MKNNCEIRGSESVIFVRCKKEVYECLIDTATLDKAKAFPGTWTGHYNFYTKKFYVIGNTVEQDGSRKQVKFHRYITDAPTELLVDHVNHNTLDNRLCNLNFVSKIENAQNRKGLDANNTSGVRGVYWNKNNNTWRARVKANGKNIEIGSFKCLEDAEKAVNEARIKYMDYLRRIASKEV